MGLLYIVCSYIPAQWFSTKRSLAAGLTTMGSGWGGVVYSLAARAMISNIGLPWAFRVLAIVSFVVNMIGAFLIREPNSHPGVKPVAFDWHLLRRLDFLLVTGWAALSIMMFIITVFSISDYARSVGLTANRAALATALINLGQAIGRPSVGLISDKFGRIRIATLFTFISGLLCFVFWIFSRSYASVMSLAIVIGLFVSTVWSAVAPIITEVVGLENVHNGMTICWVFLAGPALGKSSLHVFAFSPCPNTDALCLSRRAYCTGPQGTYWHRLFECSNIYWLPGCGSCSIVGDGRLDKTASSVGSTRYR